jgi:hypothetical protein
MLAALDAASTREPRGGRRYIGGSVIGDECLRRMWMTFRGIDPVGGIQLKARTLRIFQAGHDAETRLVRLLKKVPGIHVQDVDPDTRRQWAVEWAGGFVRGNFDGIIKNRPGFRVLPDDGPHLLELKSMKADGWKGFADLRRYGVYAAHPKYYAQMQAYMHLTALLAGSEGAPPRLERALFLAECKDNSELYTEIVAYDPLHAYTFLAAALDVVASQAAPERGRGMKRDGMACRMCDRAAVCYGEAPFERRDCRSCAHAFAHQPSGQWVCGNPESDTHNRPAERPCAHYTPPAGLAWQEAENGATETRW